MENSNVALSPELSFTGNERDSIAVSAEAPIWVPLDPATMLTPGKPRRVHSVDPVLRTPSV